MISLDFLCAVDLLLLSHRRLVGVNLPLRKITQTYKCGKEITFTAANELQDCAPGIFLTSSEINLKRIPFSAFDTLYFGYETPPENIEKIIILI